MDGFWVMVQMKRAKISISLSGKKTNHVAHFSRAAPSNSKRADPGKEMQTEKQGPWVERLAFSLWFL